MTEDPSNWATATAQLVAQLVCPDCDASNDPHVLRIHLDGHGDAACDACGYRGAMQMFLPPLERLK